MSTSFRECGVDEDIGCVLCVLVCAKRQRKNVLACLACFDLDKKTAALSKHSYPQPKQLSKNKTKGTRLAGLGPRDELRLVERALHEVAAALLRLGRRARRAPQLRDALRLVRREQLRLRCVFKRGQPVGGGWHTTTVQRVCVRVRRRSKCIHTRATFACARCRIFTLHSPKRQSPHRQWHKYITLLPMCVLVASKRAEIDFCSQSPKTHRRLLSRVGTRCVALLLNGPRPPQLACPLLLQQRARNWPTAKTQAAAASDAAADSLPLHLHFCCIRLLLLHVGVIESEAVCEILLGGWSVTMILISKTKLDDVFECYDCMQICGYFVCCVEVEEGTLG